MTDQLSAGTELTLKLKSLTDDEGEGTIHIEESSSGAYVYVQEIDDEPLALVDLYHRVHGHWKSADESDPFVQLVIFDPARSGDPVAKIRWTQERLKVIYGSGVELQRDDTL